MNLPSGVAPADKTAIQFASYFKVEWQPYFYLLWQRLQEGHVCVNKSDLKDTAIRQLFLQSFLTDADESEFISDGSVVRPIVELNGKLYLQRYYKYETTILDKIRTLISHDNENLRLPEHKFNFEKDGELDWQQVASAVCLMNRFMIVTGGPGTGKTTTVAGILKLLLQQNPEAKIALAAPTGKAAARMAESLKEKSADYGAEHQLLFNNLEPSTIHRLLGSIRNSIRFKHNEANPLDYDIIIVDESSMIDVGLFAKFLDAVKPDARLILLGDKNQLASVEAGSLFGDLCGIPERLNAFSNSLTEKLQKLSSHVVSLPVTDSPSPLSDHIVELQKSYRFSAEKGIGRLSKIVIDGDEQALSEFMGSEDEVVKIDLTYDDELFESFVSGFKSYIDEEDIGVALKKINDCRVLCALRDGPFGVYELNRRVERTLEQKGLIKRDRPFYLNRPIIITKNNYQLGLFNGDTGIVRRADDGSLRVWFDLGGELKSFAPALISNEETSFALTIHKSQGSEFTKVFMVLPDFDVPVLSKELVYTGITRARKSVILQTDADVFRTSVSRSVKRGSGLKERF